jgi:hypothetical protein
MMRVQRIDAGYAANFVSPVGIFPCHGALDAEADRLLADAFTRINWTDLLGSTPRTLRSRLRSAAHRLATSIAQPYEDSAQDGLPEARSLRRDIHDVDPSCLLHGRGYCFSKTPC